MPAIKKSPHAAAIPTDTGNSVQDELNTLDAVALPGFDFGRSGNAAANSWLLNNAVPSNLVGIPVGMSSAFITEVWVGSENVDTYDIEIYEHEGDEINLTLLTTVNIVALRTATFSVNVAITTGRQMAVRIVNGNAKNPKVYVLVKGSV